jgi:hypothetical protein
MPALLIRMFSAGCARIMCEGADRGGLCDIWSMRGHLAPRGRGDLDGDGLQFSLAAIGQHRITTAYRKLVDRERPADAPGRARHRCSGP